MGKYNGAVITTAGQNVISQAISGTELTWLTMKTSSTAIPAGTNIEALTTLSGIEQTSNITDATVYRNNVLQLSARFSNTNISTAYYIQTVGIYGQLAGGSETLIAIMTAVTPDEMPVYDPDAPSAFIFNAQITVQNAESVTMTVNDTGTATVADLNRKVDIQGGNVSSTVVTAITTSSESYPSIAEGDTVAVAAGKVNKNLSDLGSNKLDKTGDAADAQIGSSTASTASYPVPAANDTFKVILGKIIKFFVDIKAAYTNVSASGKTVTFTTAAGGTKQITTQDTTYSDFTGATSSAAGAHGLVPAPAANQNTYYLRGDKTWQSPVNNATTTAAGLCLDARMGKTLNDSLANYAVGGQITNVNDAPIGFSCIGNNGTNSPFPNFWCTILTMSGINSPYYKQQIAFPWSFNSSSKIAYRVFDNNNWYDWNYFDDSYNVFSLTLESGLSWNGHQTLQINGHVAIMHINFWPNSALSAGTKIVTLPSGYTYTFPAHYAIGVSGTTGTVCTFNISSSGEVTIENALNANAHVDVLMIGRAV